MSRRTDWMFPQIFSTARWPAPIAVSVLFATSHGLQAQAISGKAQVPESMCRVPGLSVEVQCGVVKRPLDPSGQKPGEIEVHYIVVPAKARNKLPDPVFFLAGGPGQSAIELAPKVMGLLAKLNNRRDLVFVDQRGTGKSAPLACEQSAPTLPLQTSIDRATDPNEMLRCLADLKTLPYGHALEQFHTVNAMQDLDAVRAKLGAQRINLFGASYGTRAALEYHRAYPNHVRRMVLDGVAPSDMALPESMSLDVDAAVNAALSRCEREAQCEQRLGSVRAKWQSLLTTAGLQTYSVRHPITLEPQTIKLGAEHIKFLPRGPLYAPASSAALPYAISEAHAGRLEALLGLGGSLSAGKLAFGMHYAVVCSEDMPRLKAAPTDLVGKLYQSVCAAWPKTSMPPAFYSVSATQSPVWLLSGGLDPVTPPRHGERVAAALGPKARHTVAPNLGHGLVSQGCGPDLLTQFFAKPLDADALAIDTDCLTKIPAPPPWLPVQTQRSTAP